MTFACRICSSTSGHTEHRFREMMFGTREEFDYVECGECGTIQIKELIDVSPYYPDDYYSLGEEPLDPADDSIKRRFVLKQIGSYFIDGSSYVGRMFAESRPYLADKFPSYLRHPNGVRADSRILDVGAGGGHLLKTLKLFGFNHLTGIDPFAKNEVTSKGLRILRRDLSELKGVWNLIMFHHTLEHVPDPGNALVHASKLLAPDGRILVRIPIANYAWERYGKDWFQLDPPRHLYTFTERSFRMLVDNSGLNVDSVVYDSELAQFYASEQYANDIPLLDERAYKGVVEESIFTKEQLAEWENKVAALNATGRGDQACFYLSRK
ncbi:MAG: class I SAM-dependent methyltransferase [Blastocatellia bacterium]|nr:class I SAM-dependent methyltransferase [Blastocatellia bacterium]